jgi:hypothetical protein
MFRVPRLVAALAVWLAFTAAPSAAQTVSGQLTDESTGAPIGGARVVLVDDAGERRATATTDRAGAWALRAPRTGVYYRILVEAAGYARIETDPFLAGSEPVRLQLATRREVVVLEEVSVRALAYEGVLRRAERRRSARTLLPDDIAKRIRNTGATSTGRLVSSLIAGLDETWPSWPRFRRLTGRNGLSTRWLSCDAVVAVDGIPHYKYRPEINLQQLVPLARVRAVEVFKDPLFVPSELRLDEKRNRLDPPINCGVVAIWTDEGIAIP